MTNFRTGIWHEERVEQLKVLWTEGKTCSQIAAVLGMGLTRNAIIGKVRRIGLEFRGSGSAKVKNKRPRPRTSDPHHRLVRRVKLSAHAAFVPVLEVIELPPQNDMDIPIEQRRTFDQLRNKHCRWPVGDPANPDFFFCADPTADHAAGRHYCAVHHARAYLPKTPRRVAHLHANYSLRAA